jgi:integrase/recombinase XerD
MGSNPFNAFRDNNLYMKLELGEPPSQGDPYPYFVQLLQVSGAGRGTVKIYSTAIRDFLDFIKKDPRTVTTQDVVNWIYSLSSRVGKNQNVDTRGRASTIRTYVLAVRRFLKWLGVNVRPPIPKVRNPERMALDDKTVQLVIDSCRRTRDKAIIALLLDTGLRSSELLSLKVKDVDMTRMTIVVKETKNGEQRIVFFTPRTAELLRKYINREGLTSDQPLFNLSYQALYKLVRSIGKRVGIPWLRPHILRHTFATMAIRRGVPLPAVQRILGHRDIKTTQVYTHLITEDLERSYRSAFS